MVNPAERFAMKDVLEHPWLEAAVAKARTELAAKAARGPTGNYTATSADTFTKAGDEGQAGGCSCVIL